MAVTLRAKFPSVKHLYLPSLKSNPDVNSLTVSDVIGTLNATITPTQVSDLASRILHLKADTGVTLSGGNVTNWADQSGAGNNLPVSGTSPTTTTVSGKTWLRFNASRLLKTGYIGSGGDISYVSLYQIDASNSYNFPGICRVEDGGSTTNNGNVLLSAGYYLPNQAPYSQRRNQAVTGLANNSLTPGTIGCVGGSLQDAANGGVIRSYLNGVAAPSTTAAGSQALVAGGSVRCGSNTAGEIFNLAEVAVFDRLLSGNEQVSIYNAMRRYWLAGDASDKWQVSAAKQSLFLDGYADKITIPNHASLNSSVGTWSCWFLSSGGWTGSASLMSRASSDRSRGITIGVSSTGLDVEIRDGSGQVMASTPSVSLLNGKWHHVALTWGQGSGNAWVLYVDGVSVASGTVSGAWTFNGQDLLVGNCLNSTYKPCRTYIDAVAIDDTQWTAEQVRIAAQNRLALLEPVRHPWRWNGGQIQ